MATTDTDLAAEMTLWQQIAELLQRQRAFLLSRDHTALADSNRRLRERLAAAAACRARFALTPERLRGQPLAAELEALQRRVRLQARLNSELIADALAYADFSFQLLYPQACSPVYDEAGRLEGSGTSIAVNRSA